MQKMQLFRNEAENSKDFDKDVLTLYDQMIDDTVAQIRNLENVQDLSKTNIEKRYRPK